MAKTPQINVRLTQAQEDVIAAAVFVRDLRSPQALLEPLVEQLADELMRDPDVANAVRLRTSRRRSSVVRPLDERRGSSSGEARTG